MLRSPFCTGPGCDPFIPIGLFNRFDLAPSDGANCGEYRIVFGKRSAGAPPPGNNRNLIIFEAQLQNPNPGCGMDGCRPVAQFWANLSTIANPLVRQAELQRFYFTGLPGFSPVFDWKNYSGPKGQIRSNQFMTAVSGQPWQLKEYKLRRDCSAGPCVLLHLCSGFPYGSQYAGMSFTPNDAHAVVLTGIDTDANSATFNNPWGDKDQPCDLGVLLAKINADQFLGATLGFWRA